MKLNLKPALIGAALILSLSSTTVNGAFDPDASVFNAIKGLGFTATTASTVAAIPKNEDSQTFSTYKEILTSAKSFFTSDGTKAPTTKPLSNYYNDVNKWLSGIAVRESFKTAVSAVTNATTTAAKISAIDAVVGTVNIPNVASNTVYNNYGLSLDPVDIKSLCNAIINIVNETKNQPPTSLSAHVSSIKGFRTKAPITSNSWSGIYTNIGVPSNLVTAFDAIATLDDTTIAQITQSVPANVDEITNLLKSANFKPAVEKWRTFKGKTFTAIP